MKIETQLKLLIIDQNKVDNNFQNLIGQFENLSIAGYAANAKEALVIIDLMIPDVVLIDIAVAETQGPNLIIKIKKNNPGAIIIIFSEDITPSLIELYQNLGADYFVLKTKEYGKLRSIFENVNRHASNDFPKHANAS